MTYNERCSHKTAWKRGWDSFHFLDSLFARSRLWPSISFDSVYLIAFICEAKKVKEAEKKVAIEIGSTTTNINNCTKFKWRKFICLFNVCIWFIFGHKKSPQMNIKHIRYFNTIGTWKRKCFAFLIRRRNESSRTHPANVTRSHCEIILY